MNESDKILTAREIFEEFPNKFSISTLYRLDKRNELKPCGRIGNKTKLWKKSAIEAYLQRYELGSLIEK